MGTLATAAPDFKLPDECRSETEGFSRPIVSMCPVTGIWQPGRRIIRHSNDVTTCPPFPCPAPIRPGSSARLTACRLIRKFSNLPTGRKESNHNSPKEFAQRNVARSPVPSSKTMRTGAIVGPNIGATADWDRLRFITAGRHGRHGHGDSCTLLPALLLFPETRTSRNHPRFSRFSRLGRNPDLCTTEYGWVERSCNN